MVFAHVLIDEKEICGFGDNPGLAFSNAVEFYTECYGRSPCTATLIENVEIDIPTFVRKGLAVDPFDLPEAG